MGKNRKQRDSKADDSHKVNLICFIIPLVIIIWIGNHFFSDTYKSSGNKGSNSITDMLADSLTKAYSDSGYTPNAQELILPVALKNKKQQIIHHTGFTVSYNPYHKTPNWVAYELTRSELRGSNKRNDVFVPDPQVKGATATTEDYTRSGYDRGHMAPAADMKWSKEAMEESFYLSNICPQDPELNREGWVTLEQQTRQWAMQDSAIIVVCGPVYQSNPPTIGTNKVAVPQSFFKAILSPFTNPMRCIGFLYANEPCYDYPEAHVVSVDSLEALTGFDFFSALPDAVENHIEATPDYNLWH